MNQYTIKTLEGLEFQSDINLPILDVAQKQGINFEYSCKNGQCGVCKITLLEGEVSELHSQTALTEKDIRDNKILSCCCTAKTDILIDAEDLTALKAIEIQTLPARINKIAKKAENIIELELRLPPTATMPFLEGQFIDVIGPNGVRRSYSIANSSNEKLITLLIKQVEKGVLSQYWFNEAKENDLLRIEGPKGSFFFREVKKHIIFLATGTGIAPIKSILDKLSQSPNTMQISLYWGNRKPDDFFWQPEYEDLDINYTPVLSRKNDTWPYKIGYVQNIVIEEHINLENTQVYACGSLDMIESAKELFIQHGLEEKYFHSDAFVSS